MAAAAAAALLDELMGRSRNLGPSERSSDLRWDDPELEVCKYYLCGFCPHELFVNTRADLGPCNKLHDDILRDQYQKSPRCGRMGYEDDFVRFLQGMINDVEKRIRRGHQRLALNSMTAALNESNMTSNKDDKISMLTEKINELVTQAEELGYEGNVEEAQGVLKLCDQLKDERAQLERARSGGTTSETEKTMEVCPVCGALLVVGDVQQRIDEHLLGKQHAGYARIRLYVEERKQIKLQAEEEERAVRDARIAKEREEREKVREREERRRREREKELNRDRSSRDYDRGRERSHHGHSRNHRSESQGRHRSSSRERKHRSRSRERRRSSSRDRDRRHKSSRHRRSRSGSRSHKSDPGHNNKHSGGQDRDSRRSGDRKSEAKDDRHEDQDRNDRWRSPARSRHSSDERVQNSEGEPCKDE